MKNKLIYTSISFALLSAIFLYPYVFNVSYFPIGWDGGMYSGVLRRYLHSNSFITSNDYWFEPGYFFSLTTFLRLSGIDIITGTKLFISVLFILQAFLLHFFLKNVFSRHSWSTSFVLLFSSFSVNFFYLHIFKQYLAQVFLLGFLFLFVKKKPPVLVLSIFFAYILYSHRGVSFAAVGIILILSFFFFREKKLMKKNGKILSLSIIFYLPYLFLIAVTEFQVLKDFFVMSSANVVKSGSTALGASIVDLATSDKNQLLTFVLFNPLIWLLPFASWKYILNNKKYLLFSFKVLLAVTLCFSYLVYYRLSFSSRFTTILFIFVAVWFSIAYKRYMLISRNFAIFIFSAIFILAVAQISTKTFYLTQKDSTISQFETLVDKNNSIIITYSGNASLPEYLGYDTSFLSNHVRLGSYTLLDMQSRELVWSYTKYMLTHPLQPKELNMYKGKNVYVVIGLFLDGSTLDKIKISSRDFLNSPYYRLVLSTSQYHPFKYVFKLNTSSELPEYFGEEEL